MIQPVRECSLQFPAVGYHFAVNSRILPFIQLLLKHKQLWRKGNRIAYLNLRSVRKITDVRFIILLACKAGGSK